MVYFYSNNQQIFNYEKIQPVSLQEAIDLIKSFPFDIIQFDSETTGLDCHTNKLITIQFGSVDKENQVVIDCRNFTKENYNEFKDILETKTLLGHNIKFDLKFLFNQGIFPNKVLDTQLAEMCITCGTGDSVSLANISMKYLGIFLEKETRKTFTSNSSPLKESEIIYAAKDVTYLYDILTEQYKIQYKGFGNVYRLECAATIPIAYIEYCGMKIDKDKWSVQASQNKLELESLSKELEDYLLSDKTFKNIWPKYTQSELFQEYRPKLNINFNSQQQKLKVLQCISKDITDTSDRTLNKNKEKNLFIKKLIKYNKTAKLVSSFGDSFLKLVNPITKRVHQDIWQILDTHRMSSKNPNLTQIPSKGNMGKLIRECFISENGWSIVGADFFQCELRFIAEYSEEPVWLDAFNSGKDLHSVLACMTFNIEEKDVKTPTKFKSDVTYRDVQKIVNFGLAYGMTEFKLSDTIEIDKKIALNIIEDYFKKVPKVKSYLEYNAEFAKQKGYIQTPAPFSLKRQFPEWELAYTTGDNKTLEAIGRKGKNTPIQGSNAFLTKLALVLLYKELKQVNYPVKIINCIHDEILTEVPDEHAEEWKEIMHKTMLKAGSYFVTKLTMESDCKISKFWQK